MKFKQLKGKFKNLFKRIPSPKKVAGDVVDKVKDGEKRIKHGVEESVKKSGDAVKKGVSDAVKASGESVKKSGDAVKKGVGDAVKASVDKVKHKEDPDSSTQSTFKQENHSAFKDLEIPWFRRWYMFAFFYPTIISFLLEWLRREVQGG
jgi:hypothetical protein